MAAGAEPPSRELLPLDEGAVTSPSDRSLLEAQWRETWPQALASWSTYTLLREPIFFNSDPAAKADGMAGEIAAIRLVDQIVMVNLSTVRSRKLEDWALPILAHEIGHHVYVPGNLADNARMIAAIQPVLFGLVPDTVHLVANLYGDLMINDRLERRAEVDISGVYIKLKEAMQGKPPSQVWNLYTRTYEHLWLLPAGTLTSGAVSPEMNADAALIARLVRHHSAEWLSGARRFACILYPYLHEDQQQNRAQTFISSGLADTRCAGRCARGSCDADAIPDGMTAIDPSELGDGDLGKSLGGILDDLDADADDSARQNRSGRAPKRMKVPANTAPTAEGKGRPGSQFREPFQYSELLRALGLDLSSHEVTTRYYRERALPYLIPFPTKKAQQAKEPLPEAYQTWEPADSLDDLELFGSLLQSPEVIPGVTTVQREYGETPGGEPANVPLDLDIYVDCSGSMPDPAVNVSYLALAGTILACSALRAGARVQATLWSGAGQFETSGGFVRDEKRILGIITGYIAGATAFPLHVLRDTYESRKPSEPPVHIVVISDEGIDTILRNDDHGKPGKQICGMALNAARGGGTLVLNLSEQDWVPRETLERVGFRVHTVTDWIELVSFARAFVGENYEKR
jgi:hypothetical protein